MSEGARPRLYYSYVLRNTRSSFAIIWNADGTPYGLTIDGVGYRVKRSPGQRIPLGDGATMQAIFSDTLPARRDDDPPEPAGMG